MNHETLDFEALKKLTGYSRPADVERCLKNQGVKVFFGKDGPWTILDALRAAAGLSHHNSLSEAEKIEF